MSANSVILRRALAAFIEAGVPEVRCYADERANEERRYPCVYIVDLEERTRPLGCGRSDFSERGGQSVMGSGKIRERQHTLRFQAEAANSPTRGGIELAASVARRLELLFLDALRMRTRIEFSEPVNGEPQHITGIAVVSAHDVPPDMDQEPILYRRALTVRFTAQEILTQLAEGTIGRIHMKDRHGTNV